MLVLRARAGTHRAPLSGQSNMDMRSGSRDSAPGGERVARSALGDWSTSRLTLTHDAHLRSRAGRSLRAGDRSAGSHSANPGAGRAVAIALADRRGAHGTHSARACLARRTHRAHSARNSDAHSASANTRPRRAVAIYFARRSGAARGGGVTAGEEHQACDKGGAHGHAKQRNTLHRSRSQTGNLNGRSGTLRGKGNQSQQLRVRLFRESFARVCPISWQADRASRQRRLRRVEGSAFGPVTPSERLFSEPSLWRPRIRLSRLWSARYCGRSRWPLALKTPESSRRSNSELPCARACCSPSD